MICSWLEERGLDIELRELRLALGAQVLVAEAAHDLIVAIEAAHHQQLLEDLRRLRQREELAGMRAARHEIVARAFRRRLGEHRRFDVDEAVARRARRASRASPDDAAAGASASRRGAGRDSDTSGAALRSSLRRDGTAASRSGSGSRARAPAARPGPRPASALAVPAGRARTRPRMRTQNSPRSRSASANTSLRVRIEHDLQQPFAVAQVDEDHPAVIAPAMHPAGDADLLADEGLVDLTAIVGAHGKTRARGAERAMLRTPPSPCKERRLALSGGAWTSRAWPAFGTCALGRCLFAGGAAPGRAARLLLRWLAALRPAALAGFLLLASALARLLAAASSGLAPACSACRPCRPRPCRPRRLGLPRRVGEIALAFLVRLEIGLVPAAALQAKHRRRHQPLQRLLLAARALAQRRVGDLLQSLDVELAVACIRIRRTAWRVPGAERGETGIGRDIG